MGPGDENRVTSDDAKATAASANEEPTDKGVAALRPAQAAANEEPTDKGLGAIVASDPEPAREAKPVAASKVSAKASNLTSTLMGIAPPEGVAYTAGGERARSRDAHGAERIEEGDVFARAFRVGRRMAEDAGGTAYEAIRLSDEEPCTLRVIERKGVPEAAKRRFIDDAKAAGAPGADYIVTVFDAGNDPVTGLSWVVTEELAYETLASHFEALGTGTAMPRDEAWAVLEQLAQGLAKAHERGVAHRDLTPASVLLVTAGDDDDGVTVKLSGFGFAHLRDPRRDEGRVFASGGAPLWMAPEQAAAGEVNLSADVWTLGLIAFRLLVGRSYWRVANTPEIDLSELLSEMILEPRPAASARAIECRCLEPLPDGFDDWFARCVSCDPEGRFSSAEAAARALRSIGPDSASVPVLDYASTPSRPTIPITSRPSRPPVAGSHVISADRDTIEPETVLHIPQHPVIHEVASPRGSFDEAPTMRMRALAAHDASGSSAIHPSTGAASQAHPSTRPATGGHPHASGHPQALPSARPEPVVDAMPAPAPPPPPKPPKSKWPAIVAAGLMGLACVFAVHMAAPGGIPGLLRRGPTPGPRGVDHVDTPRVDTPNSVDPVAGGFAWPRNEPRVWNGTLEGADVRLSFVLVLRANEVGRATGFFSWTIQRMAGARVGEQVRENVEGTWDPTLGTLELHGVHSTNPVLLPVNAYQVRLRVLGALEGDTTDGISHLAGVVQTASDDAGATTETGDASAR